MQKYGEAQMRNASALQERAELICDLLTEMHNLDIL